MPFFASFSSAMIAPSSLMRGSSAFASASEWLARMPSASASVKASAPTSRSMWIATRLGPGCSSTAAGLALFCGRYSPMA